MAAPVIGPEQSQPPLPPSRRPVLRPPARGSHWRLTLIGLGVLAVLVLFRAASAQHLPPASTSSPQGAVAGYLEGIQKGSLSRVERYLVPAAQPRASQLLASLKRYHASLTVPTLGLVQEQGSRAQVELSSQVCFALHSVKTSYQCVSLARNPLSLPATIDCQRVGQHWLVDTVLIAKG